MRAAVFGAAGYGGIELVRLLCRHPDVELVYLADPAFEGKRADEVYPHLRGFVDLPFEEPDVPRAIESADVVFFCLHPGLAMDMVAEVAAAGRVVIDFSADFRLQSRELYEAYYEPHRQPELLDRAVYGLPELHRERIAKADVIAVPGCYPTSATLALAPLAACGAILPDGIVVNSASGVSGMGRRTALGALFTEGNEDARAYSIGNHRHTPEIEQEVGSLFGRDIAVLFVPHLIPITRGIVTTVYATLARETSTEELIAAYEAFYEGEPFVRVRGVEEPVSPKSVAGTNLCDVSVRVDARTNRAIALAAIDNLGKGLSSAAVQCLNVRFGLRETTGLTAAPRWP